MDKNISPIDEYIVAGVGRHFFSVFGYPLLFSNEPDKRAIYAGKLAKDPSLKLPFAIASFVSDEIDETGFAATSLARRGVYLSPIDDHSQVYNLKLIPVVTTFRLTLLTDDLATPRRFANLWLFASQENTLNFSMTYGSHDFDIKVELDKNLQYPDRTGGVTEAKEYEVSASFRVHGYMSKPWQRSQTALNVAVEGRVGSEEAIAAALKGNPSGTTSVFQFNRNWE